MGTAFIRVQSVDGSPRALRGAPFAQSKSAISPSLNCHFGFARRGYPFCEYPVDLPLIRIYPVYAAFHTPPISLAFFTQSPSPPPCANKIKSFMETQMHRYKVPGAALAIVRNGEVEYLAGFGIANVQGEPVTPDTPFLLRRSASPSLPWA